VPSIKSDYVEAIVNMTKVFDINLPEEKISPNASITLRLLRKVRRKLRLTTPEAWPVARGWPNMPYQSAEVVYWRPAVGVNFGDELSRTIVELMLARRGYTVFDGLSKQRSLLALGSILAFAEDGDVVWGTGVNGSVPASHHRYTQLDIRAVRGPLTRQFLMEKGIEVPEVYGDPGLLVKRLTGSRFETAKSGIAIVPNMFDMAQLRNQSLLNGFPQINVIDPTRSWNEVIADIVKHEFIIASSLHGLVIADAFGIPSRYLRLTEHEGVLKYEDYYEGTGRPLKFSRTISQAMDDGPVAAMTYDAGALEASFPYDIWS